MSRVESRETLKKYKEFMVSVPCYIGDLEQLTTIARNSTERKSSFDDDWEVLITDDQIILRRETYTEVSDGLE